MTTLKRKSNGTSSIDGRKIEATLSWLPRVFGRAP